MSYPTSLSTPASSVAVSKERAQQERKERASALAYQRNQLHDLQRNRERSADRIADLERDALSSAVNLTTMRHRDTLDALGKVGRGLGPGLKALCECIAFDGFFNKPTVASDPNAAPGQPPFEIRHDDPIGRQREPDQAARIKTLSRDGAHALRPGCVTAPVRR